jgi:hypothetical protein
VRPSARLLERKARGSGGERLTDSAISIVDRQGQRHALQIRSRRERRVRGTLAPAPRYPAGVQPNRLGRREGNGAARTTRHTLKSPRCTRRIDGSSGSARARSTRRLDAWSRASSPLALPTLLNVRHSGTFLSQHQEHVQCRPSAKVPPNPSPSDGQSGDAKAACPRWCTQTARIRHNSSENGQSAPDTRGGPRFRRNLTSTPFRSSLPSMAGSLL